MHPNNSTQTLPLVDQECRYARLEFCDRQPANAGQKYLLACHPDSGRQETAGQPISGQSPKLQLILVHIYTD